MLCYTAQIYIIFEKGPNLYIKNNNKDNILTLGFDNTNDKIYKFSSIVLSKYIYTLTLGFDNK